MRWRPGWGSACWPFYTATRSLREGPLLRLLGSYRLRERNVYALYPSKRFLDAKVKTWVDFLKAELPGLFSGHEVTANDVRYWGVG